MVQTTRAIRMILLGVALACPLAVAGMAQDAAVPVALLTAEALMPNDPFAALKVILPEARRGQPLAQYLLGEAYRQGQGRDPDRRLARDWLGKAAGQGDARAALALADMDLSDGNVTAAITWLDRAMTKGHVAAFRRRADLMAVGLGSTDADPGGALALYGVALELGDTGVALRMADLLLSQPDTDAARARALLARGAAMGDGAAMTRLAMLYLDGIGGITDPVAAYTLLQEAVSLGSPDGAVALAGMMTVEGSYWYNPVQGLAYCVWAMRADPALTGACDTLAAQQTDGDRATAQQLAADF
jgi:hypothetical protein